MMNLFRRLNNASSRGRKRHDTGETKKKLQNFLRHKRDMNLQGSYVTVKH